MNRLYITMERIMLCQTYASMVTRCLCHLELSQKSLLVMFQTSYFLVNSRTSLLKTRYNKNRTTRALIQSTSQTGLWTNQQMMTFRSCVIPGPQNLRTYWERSPASYHHFVRSIIAYQLLMRICATIITVVERHTWLGSAESMKYIVLMLKFS
jgi:hypothetical protein